MEPSELPIVGKCMSLSDNIKDYFDERRYIGEFEQEEQRTPGMLTIVAVNLMLDELSEIGLETNQSAEELLESHMDLQVMFDLRQVFDKNQFYNLLKTRDQKQYSSFKATIEELTIAQDFLYEIIEFFSNITVDETWRRLACATERWYSTDSFAKHITAIIDRVELHSDPNVAVVNEHNIEETKRFLEHFKRTGELIRVLIKYYMENLSNINGMRVDAYASRYDKDKLTADYLPKFANYYCHPENYPKEPSFVREHHEATPHHVEYWKKRPDLRPTDEQIIMLVIAKVMDGKRGVDLSSDKDLGYVYSDLATDRQRLLLDYLWFVDYATVLGEK